MSGTVDLTGRSIFVVDDDATVLAAVKTTLEQAGANVCCFSSGPRCLQALRAASCHLLIADVKMPVMSGTKLLREVASLVPCLPVVLMTGYGDIPLAVDALKAGATDFIEKPLERDQLLFTTETALGSSSGSAPVSLKALSEIELQVLKLLLAGKTTKEIAAIRHRSVRTIEEERSRIMAKLGAANPVDLLKRVARVHIPDILTKP